MTARVHRLWRPWPRAQACGHRLLCRSRHRRTPPTGGARCGRAAEADTHLAPTVLRNEFGNGDASSDAHPFVELRNWGDSAVDPTGWHLRCRASAGRFAQNESWRRIVAAGDLQRDWIIAPSTRVRQRHPHTPAADSTVVISEFARRRLGDVTVERQAVADRRGGAPGPLHR